MQAVPTSYLYPPNHHHPPPSLDPHSHALKRTYLALLPLPQIIEICLTLEVYAPPHIKAIVWPHDISASIEAIRALPPSQAQSAGAALGLIPPKEEEPSTPAAADQAPSGTPNPSEKATSTNGTTPPVISAPPQTQNAPLVPYSYTYTYGQPPASYPHAPYYQPPQHPYTPYAYGQPSSYSYASASSIPGPSSAPLPAQPPTPTHNTSTSEELPSYEEMIVKALEECHDHEGLAPKSVFQWMAARYPLQTNFRPSASQALTKAYKRGRLEKSTGGKYRVNAAWEGGSTSRRTTRRPQTLSQTLPTSPFTHAPLPPPTQPDTSTPSVNPAYPYAGYPQTQHFVPQYPPIAAAKVEDSDAWEAAQTILKAINFGGMLTLPTAGGESGKGRAADQVASSSGPQSNPLDLSLPGRAPSQSSLVPKPLTQGGGERAELQAQLALLAAQLAELAQEDGISPVMILGKAPPTLTSGNGYAEDEEEDEMEPVPIPVSS